ncbi:MAG TPA: hypothetical protein VJ299_10415 [Steroidobacteraceae bacterium]|jgi:hypothetical protein|nr:hypothetical protein [Steroidobacteraceae bacterium]HJY41669.1 hypothetical protein [Steroidobacteraceae bacterium]
MKALLRLTAALACGVFPQMSLGDTIHAMQGGGFYHHQSGWVFPEKIGEFALVGVPTDINGTVDVAAWYAREAKGVRTVVSVTVYPPDSAEPETTPASFKAAPVSIEISKKPPVRAARLTFKEGKSSRAILYFVDAGPWIVRIRSSVPATDKELAPAIEKFVRGQRWDSLQTS